MGVLDDAIREHLELKRRHGSDPVEVSRLEREALGPVTAAELEAEDAPAWDNESDGVVFDDEVTGAPEAGVAVPPPAAAPAGPADPAPATPPPPASFAPPAGAPAPPPPPPASFAPGGLDDTFDFTEGAAAAPPAPPAPATPPAPPAGAAPPPPPPAGVAPPPPAPIAATPPPPPAAPAPTPPAAAAPPPPPAPPAPPAAGTPTEGVPAMPRRRVGGETTKTEGTNDPLSQTPEFLEETPDHDRLWFEQKPPRDFDF